MTVKISQQVFFFLIHSKGFKEVIAFKDELNVFILQSQLHVLQMRQVLQTQ